MFSYGGTKKTNHHPKWTHEFSDSGGPILAGKKMWPGEKKNAAIKKSGDARHRERRRQEPVD
jgi:hypothetical protein